MRINYFYHKIIPALLLIITVSSCKKFVEIDQPRGLLVTKNVFTTDTSAIAAMKGIYSTMMAGAAFASGTNGSVTFLAALSADEVTNYSTAVVPTEFAQNALTATNTSISGHLWNECYKMIYAANDILEGLPEATGVSQNVKDQLTGEALFVRAFCNFYLTNLFGDVPNIISTDYRQNTASVRAPQQEMYEQMVKDLNAAKGLLINDYSFSKAERIRPNKFTATALLARVYLYMGDWVNAEANASEIIANTSVYSLTTDLNDAFKKNSSEAIWQLMPVKANANTSEANAYILTTAPGTALVQSTAISPQLLSAFETGDKRKTNWTKSITVGLQTYNYPYKYKVTGGVGVPVTEYSMVFRVAEQFLIRAEARINNNLISDGIADLNKIRTRARGSNAGDLPPLAANLTKETALQAVEHEYQVEFFTEWGHRWLNLKRWPGQMHPEDKTLRRADDILPAIKSGWNKEDKLYPIPQVQLLNDPNMANAQNPGYQ